MSNSIEQPTSKHNRPTRKQIRRRRKIIFDVFKKFQQVNELSDGYAFCYPRSKAWTAKLEEFITDYQKRLPVFRTELILEPNQGSIWLHIRGPEEVKQFIQNVLNSDVRQPPSFIKKAAKQGFRVLTNQIRVMPDFLVIGAAKCGTTSLYSYLAQHPCVARSFKKEPYFFDRNFRRGFAWYRAQFPTFLEKKGKECFVTGEATPCYIFHPHVPKRVFESIPSVKLIALLRNPVDRAYAYYNMKVRHRHETLSFEEAIEREEEKLRGELEKMLADENYYSFNRQHYSYLSRGIYVDQLKHWMNFFPKDQILILTSEDFYKDPSKTYKRVIQFLNLPGWELNEFKKMNSVPYPKMDKTTRKRLIAYFEPHNQRLYEFLGMKLDWDR